LLPCIVNSALETPKNELEFEEEFEEADVDVDVVDADADADVDIPVHPGFYTVVDSIPCRSSRPTSLITSLSFKPILAGLLCLVWQGVFLRNCWLRVWQWQNRLILFETDTAAWPRSLKSHHQLGTVYHRMNRFDEALVHYNVTVRMHDDNALTDYCIAQVYIETSRFRIALPYFEKIMAGHGIGFGGYNLFALYVDYGFTLAILGENLETAVNSLEQGLKINADVPYGWNALGIGYYKLGALQEAQDSLVKALEWDPNNPVIFNNLGCLWLTAGALEQSYGALGKALEQEPDNQIFLYNAHLVQAAGNGDQETVEKHKPRMDFFYTRMS